MSQLVEPENIKEFYPNAQIAICSDSYFDKDPMSEYFYCKGDALEGLTIQDFVLTHEYTESGAFHQDAFELGFEGVLLLWVAGLGIGLVISQIRKLNKR